MVIYFIPIFVHTQKETESYKNRDFSLLGILLERVDELSNDPQFKDVRITYVGVGKFLQSRGKNYCPFRPTASHAGHFEFHAHFKKDCEN